MSMFTSINSILILGWKVLKENVNIFQRRLKSSFISVSPSSTETVDIICFSQKRDILKYNCLPSVKKDIIPFTEAVKEQHLILPRFSGKCLRQHGDIILHFWINVNFSSRYHYNHSWTLL